MAASPATCQPPLGFLPSNSACPKLNSLFSPRLLFGGPHLSKCPLPWLPIHLVRNLGVIQASPCLRPHPVESFTLM